MSVRLTQQEREDLEKLALSTGLPISDLIRRAVAELLLKARKNRGIKLRATFEK